MDKTLFMKLLDYYSLSKIKKANESLVKNILIRSKLRKVKSKVASMIDDDVLTFSELFGLLKKLEKSYSEEICFKLFRLYYKDSVFEDDSFVECIEIIGSTNDKKYVDYISVDGYIFDPSSFDITKSDEISLGELSSIDLISVSNIISNIEFLYENAHDKLISLIIVYLIRREIL